MSPASTTSENKTPTPTAAGDADDWDDWDEPDDREAAPVANGSGAAGEALQPAAQKLLSDLCATLTAVRGAADKREFATALERIADNESACVAWLLGDRAN